MKPTVTAMTTWAMIAAIGCAWTLSIPPLLAQTGSKPESQSPAIVGDPVAVEYVVLRGKAESLETKSSDPTCANFAERPVSVAAFVGSSVKEIRVVRTAPKTDAPATDEIQQTLGKVWRGKSQSASCFIDWAEPTYWTIEAVVEFSDGTRSEIVTDGWHVAFQSHDGKSWFIRLLPAAQ
jgi:hypothetical protein